MNFFEVEPLYLLTISTHFFTVTRFKENNVSLLLKFSMLYVHKAFKQQSVYSQNDENKDKVYAFHTEDLTEFRFHIGQYDFFIEFMERNGYPRDYFEVVYNNKPKPIAMTAKMGSSWQLREKQPEAVEFINRDIEGDFNSRLVTLYTGGGKGIISLFAACNRGYRVAVLILPQFLKKWHDEIKEKTTATDKDILTIQGSDYIRGLIHLVKTGQYKSNFILISMKTWNNFIESYKNDKKYCVEEEYGCSPDELIELLGIGTVIIDEIHMHMHAVYRALCFMNVDKVVGLSGTFLSRDAFIDKMQRTLFPKEIRFETSGMKKYIRAYGIAYSIRQELMKHISINERNQKTYSQNAFERSILKRKDLTRFYLELIKEVLDNGFVDGYEKGYKCIIYSRTKAMCAVITEYLTKEFPQFSVAKYTEEDDYDNLLKPDIRCTTAQSGGTGHDIKDLVTIISLDNLSSLVLNLQCIGRLREPEKAIARYFTVFCQNIPKQCEYHLQKKSAFADRVLSFKDFRSNINL